MHTYRVVKENIKTGKRATRSKVITVDRPLAVGALYTLLPRCGCNVYRVLELVKAEKDLLDD